MLDPENVNKVRGEVSGKVGKHEFVLVPNFENIQNIEANLKRSFVKLVNEFQAERPNFSFGEIATILYVAQKDDPKVSYKKIGDILSDGGMLPAMNLCTKFILNALVPKDEMEDESKNQPAQG